MGSLKNAGEKKNIEDADIPWIYWSGSEQNFWRTWWDQDRAVIGTIGLQTLKLKHE